MIDFILSKFELINSMQTTVATYNTYPCVHHSCNPQYMHAIQTQIKLFEIHVHVFMNVQHGMVCSIYQSIG